MISFHFPRGTRIARAKGHPHDVNLPQEGQIVKLNGQRFRVHEVEFIYENTSASTFWPVKVQEVIIGVVPAPLDVPPRSD